MPLSQNLDLSELGTQWHKKWLLLVGVRFWGVMAPAYPDSWLFVGASGAVVAHLHCKESLAGLTSKRSLLQTQQLAVAASHLPLG